MIDEENRNSWSFTDYYNRIKELEQQLERNKDALYKSDKQLARYYDVHHWAIQKFPSHPISKRMTEECKLPLFSPKEFEGEQND